MASAQGATYARVQPSVVEQDTKRLRRIHWAVPATLIGASIAGTAFAIGHHFYYSSLNGTKVHSTSEQRWALRIGTALAFLVKTFFTTSTAIAFVQQSYLTLSQSSATIGEVDNIFGILRDFGSFYDVALWFRHPLLLFPAIITWYGAPHENNP